MKVPHNAPTRLDDPLVVELADARRLEVAAGECVGARLAEAGDDLRAHERGRGSERAEVLPDEGDTTLTPSPF